MPVNGDAIGCTWEDGRDVIDHIDLHQQMWNSLNGQVQADMFKSANVGRLKLQRCSALKVRLRIV